MASRKGLSGAAENPDLENRLIAIESKASSIGSPSSSLSTDVNVPSTSPNITAPAPVGGISINNRIPGALSIQWTPLDNSTIDRYDIWISSKLGFEARDTFKYQVSDKHNSFTFTEGNPKTVYYIIVRGVAGSGRTGPWSSYVNSATGEATEFVVDRGAFSTVDTQEETFPESDVLAHMSATFGALPVTVETPGTLIVLASLEAGTSGQPGFTISLGMSPPGGAVSKIRTLDRNLTFAGAAGIPFFKRETILMHELVYIPSPGTYTFGIILSEVSRAYHYKISVIQLVKVGKNANK